MALKETWFNPQGHSAETSQRPPYQGHDLLKREVQCTHHTSAVETTKAIQTERFAWRLIRTAVSVLPKNSTQDRNKSVSVESCKPSPGTEAVTEGNDAER